MKYFIILILFFTISCSSKISNKSDFNFSTNMSFDEFKLRLDEYIENSSYPNIDE